MVKQKYQLRVVDGMNPLTARPKRIMVFGDIMLDIKLNGTIHKIASEAPVPVLLCDSEQKYLGGCGNVLLNLQSLGCEKLYIYSMLGTDIYGKEIASIISSYPEIVQRLYTQESYCTTVKKRGFSNKKIIFRYDVEKKIHLLERHFEELKADVTTVLQTTQIDAIVISDYNKGFISKEVSQFVIGVANRAGVPTFVDPKLDYMKYLGCTVLKPNIKELWDVFGIPFSMAKIEQIHGQVKSMAQCKETLITLSEEGMSLCTEDGEMINYKADESEVNDVTGAGDVVVSIIAYYYTSLSKKQLVQLATNMGSISVRHVGTYVLKPADILKVYKSMHRNKIISLKDVAYLKHPIVFTNGCFDILHEGHMALFRHCSAISPPGGEVLVAINSDASIRRLKGDARPINNEEARASLLNNIETIDWILVFDEDTPYEILEKIRPHTLVKGGDYTLEQIPGKEFCERVDIFTYIPGKSTTNIINRIKSMTDE